MIAGKYEEKVFGGKIFLKLCETEYILEGRAKRFFFGNEHDMQIAVFRVNGKWYALDNICPHRHQDKIHEGIIRELAVICPLHGWTYNLRKGENRSKKHGVKSLKSYEVIARDGFVYLQKPVFKTAKWKEF